MINSWIRALLALVFAATMIPSIIWPKETPGVIKVVAGLSLAIGIIVTLRARFKMWNAMKARRREAEHRR